MHWTCLQQVACGGAAPFPIDIPAFHRLIILTGSPSPPPTRFKFFGISDGFGFTKANELFVGRVAQLGFAAGGEQMGRAGGVVRAVLAHVRLLSTPC